MAALLCLLSWAGCYEERFETGSDARLAFSLDTLRFDTVFTEAGSATRYFRVYNNARLPVKLSEAHLESGENARFRINVDGYTGAIRDLEIGGQDSIWVFVEVTIDPDLPVSESPFVIHDRIIFETNGNLQSIVLEAWGQNANYFPNRFHNNKVSILSCDLGEVTWDDAKPYVIYGTLLIDSCTLVIPPGARVYIHGGLANNSLGVYNDGLIYTLPHGRMRVQGSVENPVLIRDDRLEEDYSGLWNGIRLGPGSGPHTFEHAELRFASTPLSADSASTLHMKNVKLHTTAGVGLFGRHANITAQNCLFYNTGAQSVALTYGGSYQFDYCTLASFGNDAEALVLNNFFCPDIFCLDGFRLNGLEAHLRNCIVVGSGNDEILLSDASDDPGEYFQYRFEHCIVRVNDLIEQENHPDFFTFCDPCLQWTFSDALFVDRNAFDFHLDTLSIAVERGSPLAGISTDLDGQSRDPVSPDIGCYEYQVR